jgi:PAS domain S-box-containing protein
MYNEAWGAIPGDKHPWAFGRQAVEVWPDIWEEIQPQFEKAFTGTPGGSKDALLPMQRHGYTEECYFDFTFTPIYGESGRVEGIFNAVIETTYRVINERRAGTLQRLAETISGNLASADIFRNAADILDEAVADVPFFFIYEIVSGVPVLRAHSVTVDGSLKQDWPAANVIRHGAVKPVDNIEDYLSKVPNGYWPELPTEALIVPFKLPNGFTSGFLVGGASSRRKIDKDYRGFYEAAAHSISNELNTLQSLIRERERAESLAQIDKAKTAFFSNISHEFRTPLTLMLSPLEKVLNDATDLSAEHRDHLQTSLRNTLRLHKLVNTLLDFSRIEAGKIEARFQPVDISQVTSDLASTFRSAIESAGIAYKVSVSELKHAVLVDPDMWEKIVLNLISNAFKYTEQGSINVDLYEEDGSVMLKVSDTGIGISPEHVDRIFERFYRIDNKRGRSQEGTGIGLAMVKELVNLHQGNITVESNAGKGASFTVKIPVIKDDGSRATSGNGRIKDIRARRAFVEEASKWNSARTEVNVKPVLNLHKASGRPKVLVADDNSDMREYIARILADDFDVHVVTNGEEAYAKSLEINPELVVSDVMMPKLDGFGLLKKLRQNLVTKNTPVIFLSARAGEEARIEGIRAGADDYLVKPFSSRELVARVGNQIAINKTRSETEKEFFRLFVQLPAHIHLFRGAEHVVEFFHPLGKKLIGKDITGMKIRDALGDIGQGYFELLDKVYHGGETVSLPVSKAVIPDETGKQVDYYFSIIYLPWRDTNENIQGVLQFTFDVTDQTIASLEVKEREERFRILANSIPQFVWIANSKGDVEFMSEQWENYSGVSPEEGRKLFSSLIHLEDVEDVRARWRESFQNKSSWRSEFRLKNVKTGGYRWFFGQTVPVCDESGNVVRWIGSASDIQMQKELNIELEGIVAERTADLLKLNEELQSSNEALRRSNEDLQQFAHVTSHDLKEPVRKIKMYGNILSTDFATFLPEKGNEYLARIERATGRISAMIDGVLQYSTVDGHDQFLQDIDLGVVMKSIAEDLEIPMKDFGAEFQYEGLPMIKGYPTLIHQLFYNLVNNSLKFRKKDGKPVIKVSYSPNGPDRDKNGSHFGIILEDNGVGFDPLYAEKIFESFTRLYPKDMYEGTGLGLALCRKIATRHNGFIKAAGELGKGAAFTVLLPKGILS